MINNYCIALSKTLFVCANKPLLSAKQEDSLFLHNKPRHHNRSDLSYRTNEPAHRTKKPQISLHQNPQLPNKNNSNQLTVPTSTTKQKQLNRIQHSPAAAVVFEVIYNTTTGVPNVGPPPIP